ncbi:MAG: hypothetical protein HZB51_26740 [Chloroflexi bacterium]|nr:hypothetical protein [Chloroflexota bacterium]
MKKLNIQRLLVLCTIISLGLAALLLSLPSAQPVSASGSVSAAQMNRNGTNPAKPMTSRLIDHFNDTQAVDQNGAGTTFSAVGPALGMLGGSRYVTVTAITGSSGQHLTADFNNPVDLGNFSSDASVTGFITVTYDGTSGPNLSPSGLGGVDLTNGNTNFGYMLSMLSSNNEFSLTMNVWSSATSCSSYSITGPGGISAYIPTTNSPAIGLYLPFNAFTLKPGCSTTATMSNVGAIQFVLTYYMGNVTDIIVHELSAVSVDLGDVTDSFNTTMAGNFAPGPGHVITDRVNGPHLGAVVDTEPDGQPNTAATGDDINNIATFPESVAYPSGDEDGIHRAGSDPWTVGATGGAVTVTVSGGPACLSAWIDWGLNGSFTNSGDERIINNLQVNTGDTLVTFNVPAGFNSTNFYNARFRLYPMDLATGGGYDCHSIKYPYSNTTPAGFNPIIGGEVEDYRYSWQPAAVQLSNMTAQSSDMPVLPVAAGTLALVGVIGAVVVVRRRK